MRPCRPREVRLPFGKKRVVESCSQQFDFYGKRVVEASPQQSDFLTKLEWASTRLKVQKDGFTWNCVGYFDTKHMICSR
jgi:hypothetical protein